MTQTQDDPCKESDDTSELQQEVRRPSVYSSDRISAAALSNKWKQTISLIRPSRVTTTHVSVSVQVPDPAISQPPSHSLLQKETSLVVFI